MKNLKQPKILFSIAVFIVMMIGFSTNIFSQTDESIDVSEFLLIVETDSKEIKLTCKEGCAWKELKFTSGTKKPQAIDQYGMTTFPRDEFKDDTKLSNFLFTIIRIENGLKLEGKEGTAWIDLSFSCPKGNCKQALNQKGMTSI